MRFSRINTATSIVQMTNTTIITISQVLNHGSGGGGVGVGEGEGVAFGVGVGEGDAVAVGVDVGEGVTWTEIVKLEFVVA